MIAGRTVEDFGNFMTDSLTLEEYVELRTHKAFP